MIDLFTPDLPDAVTLTDCAERAYLEYALSPPPRDVLGTLMLGILAGSKRYAHIAGT